MYIYIYICSLALLVGPDGGGQGVELALPDNS